MTISFQANFLKSTNILRCVKNERPQKESVSLVEVDIKNKADVDSLSKTEDLWETMQSKAYYPTTYVSCIIKDMKNDKNKKDVKEKHCFVLTSQKKNFEKLEPSKILGTMMFSEHNTFGHEINWLQVNPKEKYEFLKEREHKKIGTSLLDYVKDKYKDREIYVFSATNAVGFYEKNGFKAFDKYRNPLELYYARTF